MSKGIAKKYTGEKLYKYYSYNDCIKEMFSPVTKETLRYRNPNTFNDPYDCYIAYNNGTEIKSVKKAQMETVYVCSLTTSYDNLLMWSHYASSHTGFVVEYDVKELKKIKHRQMEIFSYVEYSNEIPYRVFFSSENNNNNQIVQAVYHKPECWEYEKEVRSVIYDLDKDYVDINVQGCISAIILGSQLMGKFGGKLPYFLQTWKSENRLFYMQLEADKYNLKKCSDFKDEWFDNEYNCKLTSHNDL